MLVDRIYNLMASFDRGDNCVGIVCRCEHFGLALCWATQLSTMLSHQQDVRVGGA